MSTAGKIEQVLWIVAASGKGSVRHLGFRYSDGDQVRALCGSRGTYRPLPGDLETWRACTGCERRAAEQIVREAEHALWIRARAAAVVRRLRYDAHYCGPATLYGITDGEPERVAAARRLYVGALLHLANEIEAAMLA
jgi:hypothetical protein